MVEMATGLAKNGEQDFSTTEELVRKINAEM